MPLRKWHLMGLKARMGHHSGFGVWTAVLRFTTPAQPTHNFLLDGMSWRLRILDFSRIWSVHGVVSTRVAPNLEGFSKEEQEEMTEIGEKRMPSNRFLCAV